ncbi:MAG TPA: TetR/AcrR family transcriptional regulator C-terminal domain-containing protein [Stackebrandtia sp.]|jgi:DNA-binding transcriptional regulator YhcF (GntR family)|uniref:TetR/AcrR family transcriptional regulator C-terminal domain-containing protein n=1 Tax=Stackebrandtia sp. TaxID=2023065 RepID=UPI002D4E6A89|nr:TetR/AcrR family transcriptional regulator C-terminal domain-containing protein [Stackebrandtia sp.]HZE40594.1 TetR/AcrR family transcriptional regulator C-terminal domain-containing protein [Stackebrandtia sp.]
MPRRPPYLEIAAVIRGHITSGRLRPGDRVPSTRGITRDFGVAMATATKVIAVLRDEGLVETRPGAGTIVRDPARPAGRAREPELSRDRVVAAAVALADAEGLAQLSMRRIATDLGAATMSLYRHVSSKDELVAEMSDRVFGEVGFPDPGPTGWRPRLELAARLMWTVMRRHPWVADQVSMTRPRVIPNQMAYAEWSLATLTSMGLDDNDLMFVHLSLFGHVRGMAMNLQPEAQAEQDTGLSADEWIETQEDALLELIADGRYPTFEHVITREFDYDLDAVFEYGLARLLDGVAAHFGL